ncbi:uncharacterized protein LOC129594810 isoform X2 [Paramacrobiotus metropolitanus]|uniref:uncharacterized protein LOC129594810 isoform X2 n=1 Tax=Paramacrobiotus metropolitanus TaxID=2943436 RepID=UPI0024465459|nr:uncharacterized protein LOC129594810 isoform X2 [Paramacrobiotus metropolitanus]
MMVDCKRLLRSSSRLALVNGVNAAHIPAGETADVFLTGLGLNAHLRGFFEGQRDVDVLGRKRFVYVQPDPELDVDDLVNDINALLNNAGDGVVCRRVMQPRQPQAVAAEQ